MADGTNGTLPGTVTGQESGHQMFAQLVTLRDRAGHHHYERVALADRLLKDRAWVEDPAGGGGDMDAALTRLEEDCFGDLCGAVSLTQLLEILHNVPDEDQWRRHRYDLKKIWAQWQSEQKPRPKKQRTPQAPPPAAAPLTPPVAFREAPAAVKLSEYRRAYRQVETKEDRIHELEAENARLKARVKELERELARATRLRGGVG